MKLSYLCSFFLVLSGNSLQHNTHILYTVHLLYMYMRVDTFKGGIDWYSGGEKSKFSWWKICSVWNEKLYRKGIKWWLGGGARGGKAQTKGPVDFEMAAGKRELLLPSRWLVSWIDTPTSPTASSNRQYDAGMVSTEQRCKKKQKCVSVFFV